MFLIFIACSYSEIIKHSRVDIYLCDLTDIGFLERVPMGCEKENASEWILDKKNEDDVVIRSKRNGDVLDKFEEELVLRPFVEDKEQMFKIVDTGDNEFLLQLNDKCVEYSPFTHTYRLRKCGDSELQYFKLINISHPSFVRFSEKEIRHIKKRDIIVPGVYFNHEHHKHPGQHKETFDTFISRPTIKRRNPCTHHEFPIILTTDFQPCKRLHSHFDDKSQIRKLIYK